MKNRNNSKICLLVLACIFIQSIVSVSFACKMDDRMPPASQAAGGTASCIPGCIGYSLTDGSGNEVERGTICTDSSCNRSVNC